MHRANLSSLSGQDLVAVKSLRGIIISIYMHHNNERRMKAFFNACMPL